MKNTDSRLDSLLVKMKKALYENGTTVSFMALDYMEIRALKVLIEEKKREEAAPEYQKGFEHGYKTAVKDVVKKMKEMESYGGDYKKIGAAGVPEHHAAGAGADQ